MSRLTGATAVREAQLAADILADEPLVEQHRAMTESWRMFPGHVAGERGEPRADAVTRLPYSRLYLRE
jgi:hypothetical protein